MKIILAVIAIIMSALVLWNVTSTQQPELKVSEFPRPISGAFGLSLGKKFSPDRVAEVMGEEQTTYTGKAGEKLHGTLINIRPKKMSKDFQHYMIKTTQDSVIYAIEGNYHDENMPEKACKDKVKLLAEELEAKYGPPRGKDSFGQWYSFRQTSDFSKSLKLYAHRCRTGMYSIVYSDEKVLTDD